MTFAPSPTLPTQCAEQFDKLLSMVGDTDREVYAVIYQARERMVALAYNRRADAMNQRAARKSIARRLRAHAGWGAREG